MIFQSFFADSCANIFGSITYNQSENFSLDYNFTLDNDFNTFNKNSVTSEFSYNSFKTTVKFIEENNIVGNTNSLENYFEYKIANNSDNNQKSIFIPNGDENNIYNNDQNIYIFFEHNCVSCNKIK